MGPTWYRIRMQIPSARTLPQAICGKSRARRWVIYVGFALNAARAISVEPRISVSKSRVHPVLRFGIHAREDEATSGYMASQKS
jgi:hypothetical protein